jgi:hypothetical protein
MIDVDTAESVLNFIYHTYFVEWGADMNQQIQSQSRLTAYVCFTWLVRDAHVLDMDNTSLTYVDIRDILISEGVSPVSAQRTGISNTFTDFRQFFKVLHRYSTQFTDLLT